LSYCDIARLALQQKAIDKHNAHVVFLYLKLLEVFFCRPIRAPGNYENAEAHIRMGIERL
jgi:hypothetical protein